MRDFITIAIILVIIVIGFYFGYQYMQNNPIKEPESESVLPVVKKKCETINTNEEKPLMDKLKITILKEGTGEGADNCDKVTVHYTGTLENGKKFDSSLDRGTPFPLTLGEGEVIKGWDLGLIGMKVGEKRKLVIPAELGYGEAGSPPVIPANATIIFEVEMLKIEKPVK